MHLALVMLFVLAATSALARDASAESTALMGAVPGASYNINAPITAKTPAEKAAEEQQYRQQMYVLASNQCADVLATNATYCSVTNIGVSTHTTRQPGISNQIYTTGNVSMQVEMK